ncbi:MAG: hypothetical protein ACKO85_17770, partial [Isosphaeraceae bacterium]
DPKALATAMVLHNNIFILLTTEDTEFTEKKQRRAVILTAFVFFASWRLCVSRVLQNMNTEMSLTSLKH